MWLQLLEQRRHLQVLRAKQVLAREFRSRFHVYTVMLYVGMSPRRVTHEDEARRMYGGVISHERMSYVTHVKWLFVNSEAGVT